MVVISISEIQQDFAGYLSRVQAGEMFLIIDNGTPVAEFKPVPKTSMAQRPFGLAAGEFRVPDDFDAPLPDDILQEFGGA